MDKSVPNPDYVDAPHEWLCWTPERSFYIERRPPPEFMKNTDPDNPLNQIPPAQADVRAHLEDCRTVVPDLEETDKQILHDKQLRINLDEQLQILKSLPPSRERSLAITKLQECIMWLGMDLKRLSGGKTCYENSYKENTKVDPTADDLKL